MNLIRHRRRHRGLPRDPALWAWAVVALFALLPLGHAIAAAVGPSTLAPLAAPRGTDRSVGAVVPD